MENSAKPFEVAIIGAGPAGAYLAYRLAQAGLRVGLFDPRAPWEKPCGGGITHKAWSRFDILNDDAMPRHEVFSSLQVSSTGHFFVIDQGHALYMVNRRDLSELMLNKAIGAGAQHLPLEVTGIDTWGERLRLKTEKEEFFASFVVGADGVRSVVRKTFQGPLPKQYMLASVVRFVEGGPGDPTIIRVTPFPGYCWAFPRRDCLCIGAGALSQGRELKPALDDFLRDYFPGRSPVGDMKGALLPYLGERRAYRAPRIGPNWALIGDAAGFVDTMTGEGILYAVWSADLLADAMLKSQPNLYEQAWRKAFGRHLYLGAWGARYMFSSRNLDRVFTAITVCPTLRKQFMDYIWNLPSYPRLLRRVLMSLPRTWWEWRRFKQAGGTIDRQLLGEFERFADRLALKWNKHDKNRLTT